MTLSEAPYRFSPMDEEAAQAMAHWHYSGDLAFYNVDASAEYLEEFLTATSWPNVFFRVDDATGLVGMWRIDLKPGAAQIGLAMAPELVGRGLGRKFVAAGLRFALSRASCEMIVLEVADFNLVARKIYEELGFRAVGAGSWALEGTSQAFIRMECLAATFA